MAKQDGEEEVALESCEFWSAFCDAGISSSVLEQFLPRLIPVLMKNMMYDEFDDEVLEVEAADDSLGKVSPLCLPLAAQRWNPAPLFPCPQFLSRNANPCRRTRMLSSSPSSTTAMRTVTKALRRRTRRFRPPPSYHVHPPLTPMHARLRHCQADSIS